MPGFGTIDKPIEHPEPNKLSVCMIVKDEEKLISKALDNFLNFADEIIVNDTGSTDSTPQIIAGKDKVVRLIRSKWNNDFSEARNISLGYASYGWIMWLDADDFVPESEFKKIIKLKSAPLDRAFRFEVQNMTSNLPLGSRWWTTKMFPNHSDLKFEYPCHEQIILNVKKMGLHDVNVPIIIQHWGYNEPEMCREKHRRNLDILLAIKNPRYTHRSGMAEAYFGLHEWQKGIDVYMDLYNDKDIQQKHRDLYQSIPAAIGNAYRRLGDIDKAIHWFKKTCDYNIEAAYFLARCYQIKKMWTESILGYYRVFQFKKSLSTVSTEFDRCRIRAFFHITVMLQSLGRNREAIDLLVQMREWYPQVEFDD